MRRFLDVPTDSHFPIQNLPLGVFRPAADASPRVGTRIGDQVIDLARLGPLTSCAALFDRASLNAFMAAGRDAWRDFRRQLTQLLRDGERRIPDDAIHPAASVEMLLPVEIGDYTDFYSSRHHATNVGAMLRGPDNALMPNWLHLPVAYHGRSSSIVVSGTDLHRPLGQTKADPAPSPSFGPSRAVDFELELGVLIGSGNPLGQPIPVERALDHVFGMVLVNDWSARDVQKWEYVPLGPFLAKNFGTSISPWVVMLEALEPFRVNGPTQDPAPLSYLRHSQPSAFDIQLEVSIDIGAASGPLKVCSTNARELYWSVAQQIAHHTSNGCNLRTGDLLASGTVSGPTPESRGCLLERTEGGKLPLEWTTGERRRFLEDGDRVSMTGWCQGDGYRVGFGEVTGRVLSPR